MQEIGEWKNVRKSREPTRDNHYNDNENIGTHSVYEGSTQKNGRTVQPPKPFLMHFCVIYNTGNE